MTLVKGFRIFKGKTLFIIKEKSHDRLYFSLTSRSKLVVVDIVYDGPETGVRDLWKW